MLFALKADQEGKEERQNDFDAFRRENLQKFVAHGLRSAPAGWQLGPFAIGRLSRFVFKLNAGLRCGLRGLKLPWTKGTLLA